LKAVKTRDGGCGHKGRFRTEFRPWVKGGPKGMGREQGRL